VAALPLSLARLRHELEREAVHSDQIVHVLGRELRPFGGSRSIGQELGAQASGRPAR
jgi:hypothetical protein